MLSNRNKPSALDVVVRIAPVATFLASIEAPGTAASPGSVTVPCKVAVVVWAKTLPHKNIATQSPCAILLNDIGFILLTLHADCLIKPLIPLPRGNCVSGRRATSRRKAPDRKSVVSGKRLDL